MPDPQQRYRVVERVDAGGMAEVFKGVAESIEGFKKNVAIKRILPSLTKNQKFVAMFLDEARVSLHLQHANIVHVYDIGRAGGDDAPYFIVMEYVDGANLKQIMEVLRAQGRRLPISYAVYILLEVCKGLAHAHDMVDPDTGRGLGIVHRDVSPPNILVAKSGEVKLVDFGLAKAKTQVETTDPGVVKGKFSYLSPEAANGIEVDRRADIFAVGIILYELLTSRRLFYGENDYQTVELVRQARVPSIAAQNPEVDEELEGVVRKALALDPEERYGHAMDLGDALAQYLFSRGKKVTSRDIAHLVAEVCQERVRQGSATGPRRSVIDALIQDEIVKFTSLDQPGAAAGSTGAVGARPLSPDEIEGISSGTFPLNPREFGGGLAQPSDDGEEPLPLTKPAARRKGAGDKAAPTPSRGSEKAASPTGGTRAPVPRGGAAPPGSQPLTQAVPQPVLDGLSGAVDSLEQLLEPPSRAINTAKPPASVGARAILWLVLVVLLAAVGVVGWQVFIKVRSLHEVPPIPQPQGTP